MSGTISAPSSGTNTVIINNGRSGRNFTVNQTAAGTYAGGIAGAGNFTLSSLSTNTLTLNGDNSYTGDTALNGGTLDLASSGALSGTTKVTIVTGGTLLLSGGSKKINNAATFTPRGGTLRTNGTASISETAGTVVMTSSSFIDFSGFSGGNTVSFPNSSANAGYVPEP